MYFFYKKYQIRYFLNYDIIFLNSLLVCQNKFKKTFSIQHWINFTLNFAILQSNIHILLIFNKKVPEKISLELFIRNLHIFHSCACQYDCHNNKCNACNTYSKFPNVNSKSKKESSRNRHNTFTYCISMLL